MLPSEKLNFVIEIELEFKTWQALGNFVLGALAKDNTLEVRKEE